MVALEFHSLGVKNVWLSVGQLDQIFGCPETCLVVPGARTTEISNAALNQFRTGTVFYIDVTGDLKHEHDDSIMNMMIMMMFINSSIRCP